MEISGKLHALASLPPRKLGWMDPEACLDATEKRNPSYSCQEKNPGSYVVQPTA
jgi:hypothetical protein